MKFENLPTTTTTTTHRKERKKKKKENRRQVRNGSKKRNKKTTDEGNLRRGENKSFNIRMSFYLIQRLFRGRNEL